LPDKDFNLYYTISPQDVGVNLLSYKERGEDGFFTLFIAPNVDAEQTKVIAKDVILVLDTSGSMEGEKMEQARQALQFVLDHLNKDDRFNIVTFSTGVRTFSTHMETLAALPEARRFVTDLTPSGSTDINRALMEATSMADKERPTIVIFLTDGLPTSGIVESDVILSNVKQAAGENLRVFPFGVGDDVDTLLLDNLAQELRGATAYVRPSEKIDEQVSAFYTKVSIPVLADLQLNVEGEVNIEDSYPYPLPDLFAGSQLIVTGRYRQGGPAKITLTGKVNGQEQTFHFDDLTFANDRNTILPRLGSNDFIPRLWATRKIGYLLNQIRLRGSNTEMIDEIVNLSVRYGIITPYTSFLVEEPEMALREEGRARIQDDMAEQAKEEAAAPASGGMAVDKAVAQNSMAQTDMAAPMPAEATSADGTASQTAAVTIVGNKAFVLKDGIWTDTSFDSSHMTTTPIPFPSDDFFNLINQTPELGKYFALGDRVIVMIDNIAYETTVGDPSQLSAPVEATPTSQSSQMPVEPTSTSESRQLPVEPTATMPAQSKESSQNSPNTPIKLTQSSSQNSTSTPSNCFLGLLFPMLGVIISVMKKRE